MNEYDFCCIVFLRGSILYFKFSLHTYVYFIIVLSFSVLVAFFFLFLFFRYFVGIHEVWLLIPFNLSINAIWAFFAGHSNFGFIFICSIYRTNTLCELYRINHHAADDDHFDFLQCWYYCKSIWKIGGFNEKPSSHIQKHTSHSHTH